LGGGSGAGAGGGSGSGGGSIPDLPGSSGADVPSGADLPDSSGGAGLPGSSGDAGADLPTGSGAGSGGGGASTPDIPPLDTGGSGLADGSPIQTDPGTDDGSLGDGSTPSIPSLTAPSADGGSSLGGGGAPGGGSGASPGDIPPLDSGGSELGAIDGDPSQTDPGTGDTGGLGDSGGLDGSGDGSADALKGDGSDQHLDHLKVEQGGKTFEMTEPDSDGKMDITVDDGSGTPKDFKLDWPDGNASDPGAVAGTDDGKGPDGAYHPGPDGKIHIQDGDLQITAERPDGAAGPTVVTVDDGQGSPTTYTLGDDTTDESASDDLDPPAGDHGPSLPHPADGSTPGGGGLPDSGTGPSSGAAAVPGTLGDSGSLATGMQTGAGSHPADAAPLGALPAPVAAAAAQTSGMTSMSGMGGMGAMGAGAGGGENHERGSRAYRIDGGIFDGGEKPGPRIIGSLDDDEKPAKRRG
jgi:hypothetical protein